MVLEAIRFLLTFPPPPSSTHDQILGLDTPQIHRKEAMFSSLKRKALFLS